MVLRKPPWLIKKLPETKSLNTMEKLLHNMSLNTVCEGARCPNKGECYKDKTATFMLMGNVCTRNCGFCAVDKGIPVDLDSNEPLNVAIAVKELGLQHAVITSVSRDDIADGGAQHFANTIELVRQYNPHTTIEVLIPDFNGSNDSLQKIILARPEIINHNLETVPSLYDKVRPMANYKRSLQLLKQVKLIDPKIITKTGIMVGLGETKQEIIGLFDDLVSISCDILTIGQYLTPSKNHIEVIEYVSPEQFYNYKKIALAKGLKYVESDPFVRSSYKAAIALDAVNKATT